ncbi:hypothetical protein GGI15_000720 [Coemansia interrupta]|uniref:Calcipressin n=1 Tax=Coemansia interrupta TaxID=1126814 RepID=A0A9W8HL59_9FUNG|nr:hypothetical protein GGI15_000720 [Coemansia interrupta]
MTANVPNREATNSLVILFDNFSDDACDAVREKLEKYGPLWHFAQLRSFSRCLAVFARTADCQAAMRGLNLTRLPPSGNTIRMYYSMHTSTAQTRDSFLSVPNQDKLWLISPPGSPPIDWRQTREDPPNAVHLDRRLHAALQELSLGHFVLNPADISDYDSADEDEPAGRGQSGDKSGMDVFTTGTSARSNDVWQRTTIPTGGIDLSDSESDTNSDGNGGGIMSSRAIKGGGPGAARSKPKNASGTATPTIVIQNYDHISDCSHNPMSGTPHPSVAERSPTPNSLANAYVPTARPPM